MVAIQNPVKVIGPPTGSLMQPKPTLKALKKRKVNKKINNYRGDKAARAQTHRQCFELLSQKSAPWVIFWAHALQSMRIHCGAAL